MTLTALQGVKEPIASTILHLYDEGGHYPILDVHAIWLWGLNGKEEEPHFRSGWSTFNFAATLRTTTTFQCENLTEHCGSFRPTTVKRNAAVT